MLNRLHPSRARIASWAKALPLALLLAAPVIRADVRPALLFGDNMALQQNRPVPIWGTASPREKVTVSFGGETATAEADAAGHWKAVLPPLAASAAPGSLRVTGNNAVVFTNVVVGEVWLCSGQSNMALKGQYVEQAETEIPAADWPSIRLFSVILKPGSSNEPDTLSGAWVPCSPRSMRYFSALGYFFGRDLHRALKVPVGLIDNSRGGTPAEVWTRLGKLESIPELKDSLALYHARKTNEEAEKRRAGIIEAKYAQRARVTRAAGQPEPDRAPAAMASESHGRPGNLWTSLIEPLIPFSIQGVIWYQGESNASRPERYARLFPALIEDWREQWGQGDFPFLFVQLPRLYPREALPSDHHWPRLREVQLKTLNTVTNTGMAVTIDLGPDDSNPQIHPIEKREVGARLAAWALHDVYGRRDCVPSGPLFSGMVLENDRLRLSFTQLGGGLVNRSEGPLKGFSVAGEDRLFVWAEARIEGDAMVVSSDKVKHPVAVRYAWAANPVHSLFNKAGLPASPFRTDSWPLSLKPAVKDQIP